MDKILKYIFEILGGIIKTKDIIKPGYYYRKTQQLISNCEIEQIRRDYYQWIVLREGASALHNRKASFYPPKKILCRNLRH